MSIPSLTDLSQILHLPSDGDAFQRIEANVSDAAAKVQQLRQENAKLFGATTAFPEVNALLMSQPYAIALYK